MFANTGLPVPTFNPSLHGQLMAGRIRPMWNYLVHECFIFYKRLGIDMTLVATCQRVQDKMCEVYPILKQVKVYFPNPVICALKLLKFLKDFCHVDACLCVFK